MWGGRLCTAVLHRERERATRAHSYAHKRGVKSACPAAGKQAGSTHNTTNTQSSFTKMCSWNVRMVCYCIENPRGALNLPLFWLPLSLFSWFTEVACVLRFRLVASLSLPPPLPPLSLCLSPAHLNSFSKTSNNKIVL